MGDADGSGGGGRCIAGTSDLEAVAAAGILCSLHFSSTFVCEASQPKWLQTHPPPPADGVDEKRSPESLAWPAVSRAKRSRRLAPAKVSCESPLDYAAGSGESSSSASGHGDREGRRDGKQPGDVRVVAAGGDGGTNKKLSGIRNLVQLLAVENQSLRKEKDELRRVCSELSEENSRLEEPATLLPPKGDCRHRQPVESPSVVQQRIFVLPDLNLPSEEANAATV